MIFSQEHTQLDQQFQYMQDIYATPLQNRKQKILEDQDKDNIVLAEESISKINFFQDPYYCRPHPSKFVQKSQNLHSSQQKNYLNQKVNEINFTFSERVDSECHEQKDEQTQCCSSSDQVKTKNKKKQKQIKKKDYPHQIHRRDQYPTKNFLPACRPFFLKCLAPHFNPQYFNKIPIIQKIQSNFGINMNDFQEMFNVMEFRPILEKYFKQKKIYRDLMLSRISSDRKTNYLRKLDTLEKAFVSKKFTRIN